MLEGSVADYWSRGKQHLIFDVLLGWLFNCFITGGICDLFQELETNKGIVFNSPLRTEIGDLVFLFVAAHLKNEEYIQLFRERLSNKTVHDNAVRHYG